MKSILISIRDAVNSFMTSDASMVGCNVIAIILCIILLVYSVKKTYSSIKSNSNYYRNNIFITAIFIGCACFVVIAMIIIIIFLVCYLMGW